MRMELDVPVILAEDYDTLVRWYEETLELGRLAYMFGATTDLALKGRVLKGLQ